jgi:2-amino-4-hydroxy-6-hydroxymethyldihydropteridine diphosphokinase
VVRAYIGLGGNVGDVRGALARAAAGLGALGEVRLSSLWKSAPVGPVVDQPWFLNAVAALDLAPPEPSPQALLDALMSLERAAGRDRANETPKGPRPLDLDLLLFGDAVVRTDRLVIPHPRMHQRAFVLAPLEELGGPDLVIPGVGRLHPLLAALAQPVRKIGSLP